MTNSTSVAERGSTRLRPNLVGVIGRLMALSVFLFGGVGGVWGIFRPRIHGRVNEDFTLSVFSGSEASFQAFIAFVGLSAALSMALGIWAFHQEPAHRGVSMMLWVPVLAAMGAMSMLLMSDVVANLLTGTIDQHEPGEMVDVVPLLNPGIGWLVAPFFAMLSYWVSVLGSSEEGWMPAESGSEPGAEDEGDPNIQPVVPGQS